MFSIEGCANATAFNRYVGEPILGFAETVEDVKRFIEDFSRTNHIYNLSVFMLNPGINKGKQLMCSPFINGIFVGYQA